ncbi:MAG: GNAT family N-acetyltransferase, partial [Aestuariibaculum sp.]
MKQNFYHTITTKNMVLDSYKTLSFIHNNTCIYRDDSNYKENKGINISLFPNYLKPEFKDSLKVVTIPQKKITGYSILIDPEKDKDIETKLRIDYKKSFRNNVLRLLNRFESCFNVKYRMFFGSIEKDEYDYLMQSLYTMLTNRFNQRNETNKVLKNWKHYLNTTFNFINNQKASIFVIYAGNSPVHICINHHFNDILFVSIPSYDIDYAKFGFGNISFYKLLEWSIANNYKVMDMAQGYLEYKRRWSNNIYGFNHHIIYPKGNFIAKSTSLLEITKLKFKNFLKTKNFDTFIDKI